MSAMTIKKCEIRKIVFAILLILPGLYAFSDDFTDKQKAIIYNEAIKTLRNYELYNNQIADEVDIVELNKTGQKLIDLFVSRKAIVYNDLDPSHKLSEAYEMETYLANMLLWYPDGMKISLDFENLKAGNIISHGNDIYTVDIMTTKKIDGNYLNQQTNNQTEELLYRIAFFQQNNTFENYRIAGVRSSKSTSAASDTKILAEVKSIEFSEKDMQIIKEQTKFLMNDYINFLNLLTDPKETDEDKSFYSISFLGLFKDSTQSIANDIEPEPMNRWITVTEYQRNLRASYPEGIKNIGMNIDSAEYGKVIPEGNENYYINGYIDKFFSGKYQSKTVFRDNSKYDFKVSFQRDENTFKNFKLSSIDKFGVNLYNSNGEAATQELPQQAIGSLKRSGLYLGLSAGAGFTNYSDVNLTGNELAPWTITGNASLSFEASATWYIKSRFGLSTGLAYNQYSANTSLYGDFRSTEYKTDFNNEQYLNNVTASYDSLLNFGYLSIPLSLVFHTNYSPEKWGIVAEFGIVNSIKLHSGYKTTGSIGTSGYYEQYPVGLQIISAPEYGYYTRTDINTKGKADLAPYNLSVKAFVGFTYPVNYFTTVFIGPELSFNVNTISKASEVQDPFGTITKAKSVGLSKYGIKFGVNYKF